MSVKYLLSSAVFALAVISTPLLAAEDASMHEVYLAAEAGKFTEAQAMMDKVLHDHPNSAKAHYVEAELLAKQGRLSNAEAELNTAERLQPGLSFAKPQAVQTLKARLASSNSYSHNTPIQTPQALTSSHFPWGMIVLGIGLVAFIVLAARFMSRRASAAPQNQYPGYGPAANSQSAPGNAAPMMGQGLGGGIGSGIMGGLVTGAAVGAGMVAGEALMHHFTDGEHGNSNQLVSDAQANGSWSAPDDMGGSDFGVSDNSSWDDNNGADDWT